MCKLPVLKKKPKSQIIKAFTEKFKCNYCSTCIYSTVYSYTCKCIIISMIV